MTLIFLRIFVNDKLAVSPGSHKKLVVLAVDPGAFRDIPHKLFNTVHHNARVGNALLYSVHKKRRCYAHIHANLQQVSIYLVQDYDVCTESFVTVMVLYKLVL